MIPDNVLMLPSVTINNVPELETRRLVLREIRESDAEAYFELCSHEPTMRAYGIPPHQKPADTLATIEKLASWLRDGSAIRWGLFERQNQHLIGDAGYWRFDRLRARGEIGAKIHPSFAGQGLMREALEAVLDHSFSALHLHSVEAGIAPTNSASIRLFEKLGFQQEGYRRSFSYNAFEERFCDSLLFSLLDSDWERRKK